jgi:hypothetical protein
MFRIYCSYIISSKSVNVEVKLSKRSIRSLLRANIIPSLADMPHGLASCMESQYMRLMLDGMVWVKFFIFYQDPCPDKFFFPPRSEIRVH